MTPDDSAEYAFYRLGLASNRQARWLAEAIRLADREDTMRDRGWRTRVRHERERAERRLDRANRDYQSWYDRYTSRRAAEAEAAAAAAAPPTPDEAEDFASEWEIGVDYDAHSGAGSDVDVNIRLRRSDGQQFGFAEATRAMSALRQNVSLGISYPAPPGYEIAGISWRSPERASRGWRSGDWSDLGGLTNPLYIVSDVPDAWRVGSVDE